jgi:PleD family two-component response regulator
VELVKEGVVAARAGDKERARQLFRDAVGRDPDNDSARLWLASLAESPRESLKHLEHVLALNPKHEKALAAARAARVRAGVAAAKERDLPVARELLRQAVVEDPECEKAWVWLAGVAETPDEVVAALEQALEINPTNEKTRAALDTYRAQCQASEPEATDAVAPSTEVDAKPPVVLVVDDSAMVRNILTHVLQQRGYMVRTAEDATAAVADLREHGIPGAIVLEAALPRQDGYQLCRLLRQDQETAKVPVVILTDQPGFVSNMRSHMAGANETIAKTLELDGLLKVLSRLCPVPSQFVSARRGSEDVR